MQISALSGVNLAVLIFCGFNLVIAYGCFTEALQHWEASRISATLSLIPLTTLGVLECCERWIPTFGQSEGLNLLGWVGAVLVVVGSMLCALAKRAPALPDRG
ncbi:MAG: EamA family transporter, partial [Limisphaerales bacterium]